MESLDQGLLEIVSRSEKKGFPKAVCNNQANLLQLSLNWRYDKILMYQV